MDDSNLWRSALYPTTTLQAETLHAEPDEDAASLGLRHTAELRFLRHGGRHFPEYESTAALKMENQLTCYSTAYFCMKNNTWTRLTLLRESSQKTIVAKLARFLPKEVLELLVSRYTIWFGGILIGLSLFIEENHRRSELAMYVLPKALESAWATLRGRGLVFRTGKYGDAMVSALLSLKPRANLFAAYRRRNGNGHGML